MNDEKTTRGDVKELIAELQALCTLPCATKYRDDAQERTGKQAVQALVKIGPTAVPALIQALKHQDNSLNYGRAWVARALGEIGDPRAVPALVKAHKNLTEEVGAEAVRALGKFDHPRIVPALIQALTRVSELRWLLGKESLTYFQLNEAAAVMLGKRGDPQAVPALIRVVQNKKGHWRVRQKAIKALQAIGDQRAIPALTEVLQDKALYFLLRHNAAEALEALGDGQAIATLTQALRSEEVFHKGIVLKSMPLKAVKAQARDTQVVPALVQVLQDKTCGEWEQKKAMKALGATQSPQAVAALVEFLNDKDAERWVERNAVAALQAIGTPQAVLALIEVLAGEHRHEATHALGKIGTPAVPALLEAFKHPSREVRFCAVEALGLIKDPQAVPALIEVLTNEDGDLPVRFQAVKALGLIGDPKAVPALIKVFHKVSILAEVHQYAPILLEVFNVNELDLIKEAAEELGKIMQHYSNLDLRAALPPLRRLQKCDPIFREVLERIEAATATFKDLPLPAAAPPLDVTTLPRSADAPPDASVPPPGGWLRRTLRGSGAGKATKINK